MPSAFTFPSFPPRWWLSAASSQSPGQESTQAALLTLRQNPNPSTSPSLTANQANHHSWRTCGKHLTILLTRRVWFLTSSPKSEDGFQKVAFSQSLRHFRALPVSESHQASKQSSSARWRRLLGDPHILLLADHNTSALSKFSFKEFQTVNHSVPIASEVQAMPVISSLLMLQRDKNCQPRVHKAPALSRGAAGRKVAPQALTPLSQH